MDEPMVREVKAAGGGAWPPPRPSQRRNLRLEALKAQVPAVKIL